jgi:2-C-methyl-D-erythritol 4-phosphate cytidylyltransferase
MKVGAVIVAAGRGERAGGGIPKQWRPLAGATVAAHTLRAFADHGRIAELVLVVHADDLENGCLPSVPGLRVVQGGATRGASVLAGLRRLANTVEAVLIHDAARPCVTQDTIDAVISALATAPAAAPALPVVDALWTGEGGRVTGTASREGLYRAQTPQGFHLPAILSAYEKSTETAADDVEIARRAGLDVVIVPGDEDNLKITMPADFVRAETILKRRNGH